MMDMCSSPSPVSLVQTLSYFSNQYDTWHIKLTVRGIVLDLCVPGWFWIMMARSLLLFRSKPSIKLSSRMQVRTHISLITTLLGGNWHGWFQSTRTVSRTGETRLRFNSSSGESRLIPIFLKQILIFPLCLPCVGVYWWIIFFNQ